MCWIAGGVELLYLIAANLFLNLNGLSLAFAGTNQVKATVAGGYSVIPGRVQVRNVRVTFQDKNLEFSIDVARVSLVVHLSELRHFTFHGSHLRGDGVAFRMRHRVDPWSRHEPEVSTFPPIPEFLAPAVFEATVPEAPISDAAYNLWTIHLDDVDLGVSELWAQAFRYRGKGRAQGEFELKPARKLWVGPASLELGPGTLTAGAYPVAAKLQGRIDCTVHPFDVRVPVGMAVFRYISARIRLDSPEFESQFYELFRGEGAPRVSSESGSLHVDVETRHGVFTEQSRAEIALAGLQLRAAQGELDAERLSVQASAEGSSSGQVMLRLDGGTVKAASSPGHAPRILHLALAVVSDHRDATRTFQVKEARLEQARVDLRDTSWLNRWLKGGGFGFAGGSATIDAHGRYADQLIDADVLLESGGLEARLDLRSLHFAGKVALAGKRVDPRSFTGSVALDITGHSLSSRLADEELKLLGLKLRVLVNRDQHGNLAHGEASLGGLSGTSGGTLLRVPRLNLVADSAVDPDGTQITRFNLDAPTLSVDGRNARLTTAAVARGTLAQPKDKDEQRLELRATLSEVRAALGSSPVKTATTRRVELSAALESARGKLTGNVSLAPAAWQVDSDNLRLSGKSQLAVDLSALDLAGHTGQARARLSSTGVTLGDTKQNANCPWSRVQALELDATARLLARGSTTLSLAADLRQTELNWGDFLTHADIGFNARFEPGLAAGDGNGTLDLNFRKASLRSGPGGTQGWSASVPGLALSAALARKAGKLSGTANLSALEAKGRIGGTELWTDLKADFALDALDLKAATMHGSGAVHVRNARLPKAPDPVSKWWADISLDSVFGHAEENLELGGTFRAKLRDATPGLAVLASQGSLPKWVASAFPLRDLAVTGSFARRCRLTDIHLTNLSGGGAVARGRLQSVPTGFQGALLLRLAGLQMVSAGLDFDSEHTHFGMFSGDDWLSRFERSFDHQSERAVQLTCPPDPNTCQDPAAGPTSVAATRP